MSERDPELEKRYREHSREEPPSALDAAILAAAYRAVASGPRKAGEATRPQRWWMPLAAAAAIGVVAIGVLQQMPKETALDATSVAPATQPAPAPAEEPATSAEYPAPVEPEVLVKKQKEADAPAPPPAASAPKTPAAKPSTPTPPAPAPAASRESKLAAERAPEPFPAAPERQKTEVATSEAKRDVPAEQPMADARKDALREERPPAAPPAVAGAASAPPASAPAPAPSPGFSPRMRAQSDTAAGTLAQSRNVEDEMRTLARDPDAWIARIRKLRDDGNTAQALREIKEFRALVPDAERRLPQDLRALQP